MGRFGDPVGARGTVRAGGLRATMTERAADRHTTPGMLAAYWRRSPRGGSRLREKRFRKAPGRLRNPPAFRESSDIDSRRDKGAAKMPRMNMVEAIRAGLRQEMERDAAVMLMGEDVGQLGGVFRATDGLRQFFGPNRVIDTPLAESVIAGAALGLAVAGWRPIVEIQFLGFAQQCFHQINQQISRIRFRTRGSHTAPLVIRSPFGGGVRTPEFHSDSMEHTFAQSSGLKVVMPANPYDAKGMLAEAIRDPDPVLFLEPLRGYRLLSGEVPSEPYTVPFGELNVLREGGDVTLVAWSQTVPVAEKAAGVAAEKGIGVHLVDLRTLVPLDEAGLVKAVERTGRCVVVHESQATAGFGAEVAAFVQEHAFFSLEAPVRRVAAPDAPYPMPGVEDAFVPDAARVVRAIEETMTDR